MPEAGDVKLDYHFDGLELDTVNYPHDDASDYMHRIDERVADTAAFTIKNNGPDLSWVYLEYTDDMGHRYGDDPEFIKALGYADELVGVVWQSVQYKETGENR